MTISKNNKMMAHLNYKMKVIVQDSRVFVGYFKAFDKHMNIILADCEELRVVKVKPGKKIVSGEEKRVLGLILLRGDKIISISVEGPPAKEDDSTPQLNKAGGLGGVGMAKPAGRGMPIVPQSAPGLQGPVRGIGGPGVAVMQPGFGGSSIPGRPY